MNWPLKSDAEPDNEIIKFWSKVTRRWNWSDSPIRPSAQDIGFCIHAISKWLQEHQNPQVLMLGVTPEFYHIPWPKGTDLISVDNNPAMIEHVWPGNKEQAYCMNWLDMDFAPESRDMVYSDAGLMWLPYPEGQLRLANILKHFLADQGMVAFRLFSPPQQRETLTAIIADCLDGKVQNPNLFKLRLMLAFQENPFTGIELGQAAREVFKLAPQLTENAQKVGWSIEQVLAPSIYSDSRTVLHLPTADAVVEMYCGQVGGFELMKIHYPDYEYGQHCPTVILQRKR